MRDSYRTVLIISGFLYLLLFNAGCFKSSPEESRHTTPDHTLFDSLLHLYVDSAGLVNYAGFAKDSVAFKKYLTLLKQNPPSKTWTDHDKLAYWINAYNAFTIELILHYKPPNSIKDITNVNIPFVYSPWQIDFIEIGETFYNLDDIEHGILRKYFDEPRIHFALVCAARSCPPLRQEAYTGIKLDKQLTDQAIKFLSDTTKNQLHPDHLLISSIFNWYSEDFTKTGPLIDFISRFTPISINKDAEIEYVEYNWKLNGL